MSGQREPRALRVRPATAWAWFMLTGVLASCVLPLLPGPAAHDVLYTLVSLAAVGGVCWGIRVHRPRPAAPWWWMAAGFSCWVVGDTVYSVQGDLFGVVSFPTGADAVYLLAYPVLVVAISLLIRSRRPTLDVASTLDSLTVAVGLGLLFWVFVLAPTLREGTQSALATSVNLAYPTGDLILLAGLVRLTSSPGFRPRALRLLIAALGLVVVADTAAAVMGVTTNADTAQLDPLWLLGYTFWGAATLHPTMVEVGRTPRQQEDAFNLWRLGAAAAAAAVGPSVLAVQSVLDLALDVWPVVVATLLVFGLVLARMYLAITTVVQVDRQRQLLQDELVERASHDGLTGLPNRTEVLRHLAAALHRARRGSQAVAVLFVDLDGFKQVNDTMGHPSGDRVLATVAARLSSDIRGGDVAGRLGGDEFIVLLEPVKDQAAAVEVADRLTARLSEPLDLGGVGVARVGASIGVAISHASMTDADDLLWRADQAAYRAKSLGGSTVAVFDEEMQRQLAWRSVVEARLDEALRDDELALVYDPVIEIRSWGPVAFQPRLRWSAPGARSVTTDDMHQVATMSDRICDLDAWVLREAATQVVDWLGRHPTSPARLTVRLSQRHLSRTRVLDDVTDALVRSGLDPDRLALVVAESELTPGAVTEHLRRLRETGVLTGLDDFGSGRSPISWLEDLPIDGVRLDLPRDDPHTDVTHRLTRLTVDAAHAFGLPVVAKGVHTSQALEQLAAAGVDAVQGPLLGEPASLDELGTRDHSDLRATAPVAVPGSASREHPLDITRWYRT